MARCKTAMHFWYHVKCNNLNTIREPYQLAGARNAIQRLHWSLRGKIVNAQKPPSTSIVDYHA